jgi:GAG-polyprotein viral zinc-finger
LHAGLAFLSAFSYQIVTEASVPYIFGYCFVSQTLGHQVKDSVEVTSIAEQTSTKRTEKYAASSSILVTPLLKKRGMIYVLLLQENKFYVGYSERPIGERFIEHFNYKGSKWTTLYRPLQVLYVQNGGIEVENETTLSMMDQYGWWNVRGGSWCKVEMNSCPPALLERQRIQLPTPLKRKQAVQGKPKAKVHSGCTRCGRNSHTVQDCYAKTDVDGRAIEPSDIESDESESDSSASAQDGCYRCGRKGHWQSECYARTDANGNSL